MRTIIKILIAAVIVSVFGCTEKWDDHYNTPPETINKNVWEGIKGRSELSSFVALVEKYKLDTLFLTNDTYTLFVPDNSAFAKLVQSQVSDTTILKYHISRHFVQPVDIQGKRKLQTLGYKFSTFENINGKPTYDGISLNFESPLYLNGKFFIMSEVAMPRLTLYQYIAVNNHYLKHYIDSKDTIIIDYERSTPLGFDDKGNTIYDTVAVKYNKVYDMEYGFRLSDEYRKWTATLAFPKLANYESGLDVMAQNLGGKFQSHEDIPVKWQEEILIPYMLERGLFLNMLSLSEFKDSTVLSYRRRYAMINLKFDSININYKPAPDPYLCSNGLYYDYQKFDIPVKLYSDTLKTEGESLARRDGTKYILRKSVIQTGTPYKVVNYYIPGASNDSIFQVDFPGYKGAYSLTLKGPNMFPRRYRMEIHTNMYIGGIYDIYVNDVLVKHFDYTDYVTYRKIITSVTGEKFGPKGDYNRFDCWVDNITDYGRPSIRFEYKGPSSISVIKSGLVIDVIKFLPVK